MKFRALQMNFHTILKLGRYIILKVDVVKAAKMNG